METSPRRASTSSSTEESDSSSSLLDQAARGHKTGSDRGLNENLAGYLSDLAVLSSRARHQPNATEIITQAITLVRDALKADYCALYEVASETRRFVMRQGCGWRFNLPGEFELDDIFEADDTSELPFMTDGLVPDVTSGLFGFMRSHHVGGGVNARIESTRGLLGLLAVYTTRERKFAQVELDFLQLIANIVGGALEAEHSAVKQERAATLEAARLKSAFLANTTHEIRSPLNVILGYSELVAENLSEAGDESQARYLDAVRRAGRRLLSTVEKIIDYAKLESGDFNPHSEPLDVAALVTALMEEHRGPAEEKGLTLLCGIEAVDTIVSFDRHCLESVIANPLLNAIKFTEAGYVSVRLHRTAAGKLKLEISDSGIGIDAAHLTRLFEPFSQEDFGTARRFEGAGLGLALTGRYAAINGALLEIQSRKGCGTTVSIQFDKNPRTSTASTAKATPIWN